LKNPSNPTTQLDSLAVEGDQRASDIGQPIPDQAVGGSQRIRLDARGFDLRDYIVYISFVVILVFFALTLRDTGFLTLGNFMSIIRETTPITVMAVGMVFVLSAGEIDLSVGAIIALSSLAVALTFRHVGSLPLAIVAGLGVGLVAGIVNGTVLVTLRIPSFLVTLGTLSIYQGVARAVTLQALPITNDTFNFWFGSGQPGGVSI